jgi:hypothetical protein
MAKMTTHQVKKIVSYLDTELSIFGKIFYLVTLSKCKEDVLFVEQYSAANTLFLH